MKKILLMTFCLIGLFSSGYSQDKIITLDNDTIYCKITKVSEYTIYFEMNIQGVKTSGKVDHNRIFKYIISDETNPAVQQETEVKKDPFENPDPAITVKPRSHVDRIKAPREKKEVRRDPYERLSYSMSCGPGYLVGNTKAAEKTMTGLGLSADQAKSYYKEMKSGLSAGAELSYLITPNFGAAVEYKFFDTHASIEGFFDSPDMYNLYYGSLSEQIYINFIGGTFICQTYLGKKKSLKLNTAATFGYTYYRNEAGYLTHSFLLTGKHFGTDMSLGLDYFISKNFAVGTEVSLFKSSIRKMSLSDGYNTTVVKLEKGEYENLSRLEFSVGIRVYLWTK